MDYEKLNECKDVFSGIDVGFCCLGTTKRDAGSAVSVGYVLIA